MDTVGSFTPDSRAAARERYETLGPVAQRVVRAVARAMDLDEAEYEERVTPSVVETAREVLFAADLEVTVGDRATFQAWVETQEYEVREFGADTVDMVAWHAAPFAETAVATTFGAKREAAIETCRRQAMGELYRDVVG